MLGYQTGAYNYACAQGMQHVPTLKKLLEVLLHEARSIGFTKNSTLEALAEASYARLQRLNEALETLPKGSPAWKEINYSFDASRVRRDMDKKRFCSLSDGDHLGIAYIASLCMHSVNGKEFRFETGESLRQRGLTMPRVVNHEFAKYMAMDYFEEVSRR